MCETCKTERVCIENANSIQPLSPGSVIEQYPTTKQIHAKGKSPRNSAEEIQRPTEIRRRVATQILAFLQDTPRPIYDLGEPNYKKSLLSSALGQIPSVYGIDFDCDELPVVAGTWFCFEILEHLYNPLHFLEQLRTQLEENGVIYLSTPARPHFLWTEHHFHEIDDQRIQWLFDRAQLKICRQTKIRLFRGWRFHLSGIRPLLRVGTYTRLYELRPA